MFTWDSKVHNFTSSLSLLIIIRYGRLAEIRWSVHMSKCHRSLCVSFSRTDAGLCIYNLFVGLNFNFWHNFRWFTLRTQSCRFSFCANLLHSLITWLMVSSLSLHNLHLLFCCFVFILSLIWLVLMALFCSVVRIVSVSLRFLFLSHVQVFSCEMLLMSLKTSVKLFCFPFLFSGYCRSVGSCVVSIGFGSCHQYFSALQILVSMCQRCFQCWQVLLRFLFLTHIVYQRHLWYVIHYYYYYYYYY